MLTNPFASSLRQALTGGGNHKSFGIPSGVHSKDEVTISQLDDFARKQWEGVLGYMVGSTGIGLRDEGANLSPSVKHLLQYGGLVDVKGRNVDITQDGFAFVLQEVNAQVWTILVLYLENAEQVIPLALAPSSYFPSTDMIADSSAWIMSMCFLFSLCLAVLSSAKHTAKPT